MTSNKPLLTLYSRNYCHLCHDMLAALHALCGEHGGGVEIAVVDVDAQDDATLLARYDELVPVLVAGCGSAARELCHYRLDEAAVRAYLGEFR